MESLQAITNNLKKALIELVPLLNYQPQSSQNYQPQSSLKKIGLKNSIKNKKN